MCTTTFAPLGADDIKIETPDGGDETTVWHLRLGLRDSVCKH